MRTTIRYGIGYLGLLGLLLAAAPALSEDFFVVDTTEDEMDGSCDDGDCSLRDAMSLGEDMTVVVPAGTYTLDSVGLGAIAIDSARMVLGAGADVTIIQAHTAPGMASSGVFSIFSVGDQVSFVGVTIRHGHLDGVGENGAGIAWDGLGQLNLVESEVVANASDAGMGGGIYFEPKTDDILFEFDSMLTLIHTVVSDNDASQGGGIFVSDAKGLAIVSLDGSTLRDNDADNNGGGLQWSSAYYGGSLSVSDSTVSDNTATNGSGGGINVDSYDSMNIEIRDSMFEGNHALGGSGGALSLGFNYGGSLLVLDSSFRLNTAAGHGGAIFDDSSYSVVADGCTFDENKALPGVKGSPSGGGGLYAVSGFSLLVKDSVFTDNLAGFGGALYSSTLPSLVTGSSFTSNEATGDGGAIELGDYDLALDASTFTGNSAGGSGPSCHTPDETQIATIAANTIDDPSGCTLNAAPSGPVYVVDTPLDVTDGSCLDGSCSLRDAMEGGGVSVTVVIPAGTYTLDAAENGAISVAQSRIVLGAGAGLTIIEGHTDPGMAASGVFSINAVDYQVSFLGVTIRHGHLDNETDGLDGAGIYWAGTGQLNLIESEVVDNHADTGWGGGILFETTEFDFASQLTLVDSVVSNNEATVGGGIFVYDFFGAAVASLDRSVLEDNTAEVAGGLAWSGFEPGGSMSLSDCTVSDNTAAGGSGGGILVVSRRGFTDLKIRASRFERNAAQDGDGGALAVFDNGFGSLVVLDTSFTLNTAAGFGGAIFDDFSDNIVVYDSRFDRNEANPDSEMTPSSGGGLYAASLYSLLVKDSQFTGNSAGFGGGLYSSMKPELVTGSSFTTNSASEAGGGIHLDIFDLQLADTTLLNNTTGNQGPACFVPGDTQMDSLGGNRIDYLDDCMFNRDDTDVIPEPSSFLLQITALLSLSALRRRRTRGASASLRPERSSDLLSRMKRPTKRIEKWSHRVREV